MKLLTQIRGSSSKKHQRFKDDLFRYLEMNDEARKQYENRCKEIEERVAKRLYFKAYRLNNKERLKEYERSRYLKSKEKKK